jgi:hypothetical protein
MKAGSGDHVEQVSTLRRPSIRKETIEPAFGIIKSILGFDQSLMRGLEKVALNGTR